MKKYINCFAAWLYKKTYDHKNSTNMVDFLSGIRVMESSFVPSGNCFLSSDDIKKIGQISLLENIMLKYKQ
jgi:hypothetical protein